MRHLFTLLAALATTVAVQQPIAASAADADTIAIAVPATVVSKDGCIDVPITATYTFASSSYNTKASLSTVVKDPSGTIVGRGYTPLKYAIRGTSATSATMCSFTAGGVYTVQTTMERTEYEYCIRGVDELYCDGWKSSGTATATTTTTAIEALDVESSHRAKWNSAKRLIIATFTADSTPAGPYAPGDPAKWTIRVNGQLERSVELGAGESKTVKVRVWPRTSRATVVDIKRGYDRVERIKIKPTG